MSRTNTYPKVLFLTKYPESGASSRYRVFQYLPYLKSLRYEVQSLLSEQAYQQLYNKGSTLKKIGVGLKDYMSRILFLFRHLDAEVVYMQRELFAFGPLWAEWMLSRLGKKLIFDLDDALFINKQNQANPFKWDKASRVQRIIQKADLVVAGNPWIREECLRLGAKRAIHFDVAERIYEPEKTVPPDGKVLSVLWLGSPTTCKYLKLIEDALLEVQGLIPIKLYLVGGDHALSFPFQYEVIDWSKEAEQKYLQSCDVGLMPLPDEPWSKGKCGGKARTYMAAGLVPVVSDIGYNQFLIKNQERGFLCATQESWKAALLALYQNPDKIQGIREANYAYVKANFDQKELARQFEKIILSTLSEHDS